MGFPDKNYLIFPTLQIYRNNRMNVVRKDGPVDISSDDIEYLSILSGSNHFIYEGVFIH